MKTPGVKDCATVVGYNFAERVTKYLQHFFFINLEEWAKRKKPRSSNNAIKDHISSGLARDPRCHRLRLPPPAIPDRHLRGRHVHPRGSGRQGYSRSSRRTSTSSWRRRGKRPELAAVSTTFLHPVPQIFMDVDRDKC